MADSTPNRSSKIVNIFASPLRYLLMLVGLVFAPVSVLLALILFYKKRNQFKSFSAFIKANTYTAIGFLVLEVVLHWLLPFTNIVATSILSLLGGPLVWIILGCAALALLGVCILNHFYKTSQAQAPAEPGPSFIARFVVVAVGIIFAPISTLIGLLIALTKKNASLVGLIKNNPFIAFGFVILEVGLLHWLIPQTNFIMYFTLGAVSTAVSSPILWLIVALALAFIAYSIYRSFQATPIVSVVGSPTPSSSSTSTNSNSLSSAPTPISIPLPVSTTITTNSTNPFSPLS